MIVPAYNAETTLAEAVGSAVAGTYQDIEVIIIDDGSTDGTFAVAQGLARTDARIHVRRQPNGGVSAAFNAGLAMAQGKYIARLDADDLWHPAKLERQMSVARGEPQPAFIYTFVRYIDVQGRVTHDGPDQRFPSHALCRGIYESLVGANSSALMQRSMVTELGGYDEALTSWEDLLLQLKIGARAPIACVPEYLVGYRVRPGSLSANATSMLRSWQEVRRKIRKEFPDVPAFVDSWAHGKRCAGFAESFAWRGDHAMCARLLAEAARTDWTWTATFLASRSARRLRRGFAPARRQKAQPMFSDCDPRERVSPDESERTTAWLSSLETERIAKLSEIDATLAGAPSEATRPPSEAGQGSSHREPARSSPL